MCRIKAVYVYVFGVSACFCGRVLRDSACLFCGSVRSYALVFELFIPFLKAKKTCCGIQVGLKPCSLLLG